MILLLLSLGLGMLCGARTVLGLLLAAGGALLLFWNPWWGLAAAFFSITSALVQFVPHFDVGILTATLAAVAVRKLLRADYTWRLPPVAVWLLLLLAWLFAGLIWQPLIPITRLQTHWYLIGVMYILLVWELVRTPRDLRLVLLAVAAGCLVTAGSTLHEIYVLYTRGPGALGADKVPQLMMLRFYGHWLGPNMLAHTLMPFTALLPALLRRSETRGIRILTAVALAGAILAIFLSQSRAGILALVVALAVSFYPSAYRGRLLILGGSLTALFLLLVPLDFTGRFAALLGQRYDSSLAYRSYALEAAIAGSVDSFPFGAGWGAFSRHCRIYLPFSIPLYHAHNTYMQILNEAGVPGLLLLLGVFFHFVRTVWTPLPGESPGSFARGSRFALLGAVTGFFVACLFEHLLHLPQLWAFFGLISVYPYIFGEARHTKGDPQRDRPCLTV